MQEKQIVFHALTLTRLTFTIPGVDTSRKCSHMCKFSCEAQVATLCKFTDVWQLRLRVLPRGYHIFFRVKWCTRNYSDPDFFDPTSDRCTPIFKERWKQFKLVKIQHQNFSTSNNKSYPIYSMATNAYQIASGEIF